MGAAENQGLKRMFGPTADCPALERLLEGQLTPREQAHAAECSHCKTELALYQSFEEAAPRPDETASVQWIAGRLANARPATIGPHPGSARGAWWRRWSSARLVAPASLALASLLVIVGIVQLNRRVETPANIQVTGNDTMRSQTLTISAPLGQIGEVPKTLDWSGVAGASQYSVRVLEIDKTPLWETKVSTTSVALPDSVLTRIVPHKRMLWEVAALNGQGNQLASSGTKDFVLIPK